MGDAMPYTAPLMCLQDPSQTKVVLITLVEAGLAGSQVEHDGEQWSTESPMGRVTFRFAPHNEFGVLDHDVTLPSGDTVHNPLRVISDGNGCEVIFTLRQRPEMSDEEFERDADAEVQDLARQHSLGSVQRRHLGAGGFMLRRTVERPSPGIVTERVYPDESADDSASGTWING